MEGIGIVLNAIGALLIAYSQFEMNRTISMWLRTLDLTFDQLVMAIEPTVTQPPQITRVRGLVRHWNRDLQRDRWMSPLGWLLFVSGFFILLWVIATRTPH
jgi:hypothetical protein